MNEQEKARELVERFYKATVSVESIGDKSSAKQCALICVEEIIGDLKSSLEQSKVIDLHPHVEGFVAGMIVWWQNVKSEIEKL